ncbi:MAG: hypothetical protein ACOYO1_07590 [Bacteroidales bacterium]
MKKLFTLILIAVFVLPSMAQTPPPMPSKEKKLNLTVFLQGLYNGTDMNKAQDFVAGNPVDKFSGTIADVITVELHDAVTYATINYTVLADLNQNGTATTGGKTYISIPNTYSGSYYITVKHRNHVETTTANPVSFTDANITCNFTDAATKAFGSNMKLLAPGVYGLFAGDINGDGLIEPLTDLAAVKATIDTYGSGYVPSDINGDGNIEPLTDLAMVKAAIDTYVTAILP